MAARKNLPIGVQDFEKLRTRKLLYIDKTQYVADLLEGGGIYFLSRPRRFGKSLFLSTLEAYFEGKKELFAGLALEQAEQKLAAEEEREAWATYPVLHIDLNAKNYINSEKLIERLSFCLDDLERKYDVRNHYKIPEDRFQYLITTLYQRTGKQVVILIDEYDKPLMDALHLPELYETYRGILQAFYSVIKNCDAYLRFVFLTGVSRFGKLTIFSGLNSLMDITMDDRYAGICGITEEELLQNFGPEIELLAKEQALSYEGALAELKKRYDGYQFTDEAGVHVYNPFSLLNVLQMKKFDDYWYATGTPTFLVKFLQDVGFSLPELDGDVEMAKEDLQMSPMEVNTPIPILFQAGYLTIKEYIADEDVYRLGFPNEEVRYAFMKNLLKGYFNSVKSSGVEIARFLREIRAENVDAFMKHLQSLIGGIPYSNKKKEDYREENGEVAVYLVFSLMGKRTETEVHTPGGRADAVVHTENAIYIFEFKMEGAGTPEEALAQIKERGYANRYIAEGKKIVCVGVTFDPKTRNISDWHTAHL